MEYIVPCKNIGDVNSYWVAFRSFVSNSFKSIYRSFHIFNCRQLFRTSGPHQYSELNKKFFEKLTNRRIVPTCGSSYPIGCGSSYPIGSYPVCHPILFLFSPVGHPIHPVEVSIGGVHVHGQGLGPRHAEQVLVLRAVHVSCGRLGEPLSACRLAEEFNFYWSNLIRKITYIRIFNCKLLMQDYNTYLIWSNYNKRWLLNYWLWNIYYQNT